MSKNSDLCNIELFSSFLAGILLIRREISNKEFYEIMNEFINLYSVNISDDENFCLHINIVPNGFYLVENYDDIIIYNKKRMTVKKYLNSLVSLRVKKYLKSYHNFSFDDYDVKKLIRKI